MTAMNNTQALLQALLACEIAGVGLDVGKDVDPQAIPDVFVLDSPLSDVVMLRIEHDPEEGGFAVSSIAMPPAKDLQRAALLALGLNHPASASDRFSLDLVESTITFKRRVATAGSDLADLALAIRTATEVGLAISRCEFPEILAEAAQPVSAFGNDPSVVRG